MVIFNTALLHTHTTLQLAWPFVLVTLSGVLYLVQGFIHSQLYEHTTWVLNTYRISLPKFCCTSNTGVS